MSSKKCCLRQHIRGQPANLIFIDLSLDNTVLKFLIRGPNRLDSHIEEDFELYDIHETRPDSGSWAILYTQNGFAFLEALTSDVSVESLGRNFDGVSAHTGMKVRPSTSGSIPSTLQLLSGQSFYIGKTTLSLVPAEHGDFPINSSDLSDSNLESYNYQVSQMQSTLGPSTPQSTARVDSAVMETPMPHRDYKPEDFTPILKQVTGQAISGRKDSKKWPESPLKRNVMHTVRDASEHGNSTSPPEFKKEDEHMTDAAVNEPNCSNPQLKIEIEDVGMGNAIAARPLEQNVVDLEDTEMAGADLRSEHLGKMESFSSIQSQVHPEGGPGCLGRSPILKESKPLSSSLARVQPERGPQASDQSPTLQASSYTTRQLDDDDDDDDSPARKRAKTAAVSHEALIEESEDRLQNEVIFVKRGNPAPTARPVSADQASSSIPTRSPSANQLKQRSPTPSTKLKHPRPVIGPNSRPHPANQPPSESSFNSIGQDTRTPPSNRNPTSASRSNSVEPNSSMRSTRSTARDEHNSSWFTDAKTRIVFASSSSAGDSKPFLKFLSNKGVKKVQSVHNCTVLCVGKELKKTSKLILAVLLGKDIITDSWVTDSVKGNDLLSVVPYMARDLEKEADWGISLDEAIYRGKQGLRVLQDQTILFTPSAKKDLGKNGFEELKEIVKCAGAKFSSALPKKSPEETSSSTVVVATHEDTEGATLQKLGWRVYVKDIISLSILRGKLDVESDEFLIKEERKESRKRKR
ncbi:MAG: hypothetical protein ASARMPREDX12_001186 [Alectoria sarmentosa]|nr:MAG: hypothetical protein ASARMPREDX12_001186 [Alectoria sarmentosa]